VSDAPAVPLDPQEALAEAARAGIHCIPLPTPFLVGRVNCYLIEDDPLTLVDTGPNSGKALDELQQALAVRGHAVEDLGLIVVTHQHIDHIGLLEVLTRRSGAEVAALDRLQSYLGDFRQAAELDDEFAVALMLRHGIPPEVTQALRSVSSAFRGWGSGARVTRPLVDGTELTLRDRSFAIQHRPGHSPSDTVFWDERGGILLGGDHLIKHISSNPLVARPLEAEEADPATGLTEGVARPQALRTYIASLTATRALPARIVLSGHGEPVTDHRALIDERFALTERRAHKIHGLLGDGRLTAHELAQRMWGNVAVTQAFLTLSEVLGHLDLLHADGKVREHDDAGVVRFEAAVPPPAA
jgi:glyoxylase-like metal-dependent hydrolase (beta-lactamase superfamily II)